MRVAGRAWRLHLMAMGRKAPIAEEIRPEPRRKEHDRRERRAAQRNVARAPVDPVESSALLSFPDSDTPGRIGRRRK
jgi:hypothetical protein